MIKISSIIIGVSDLHRSKKFYEDVFGFMFEEFRPPFSSALFDSIEFNIEENSRDRSKDWVEKYVGGRKSVCFQVDNLEDFLQNAQSCGAKIIQTSKIMPWNFKEAVMTDLDGNEFVIEQKL